MSGNYKQDKDWSDRFERIIKRILGEVFIITASKEEDCEEATDLIIMKIGTTRIGCRIRHNGYLSRYYNEFTIRSKRDNGCKTELEKIVEEGWCDYNFYGFSNRKENRIIRWLIYDLNIFREEYKNKNICIPDDKPNGDGTYFKPFDINQFQHRKDFIVAFGNEEKVLGRRENGNSYYFRYYPYD